MNKDYLQQVLGDIHYPIDKGQLVQEVEKKGAQEVVPMLKELPEQKFGSMEEVLGKMPIGNIGGLMKDL